MQNPGHERPFELVVKDYVWNETSNRVSGPDGPLRLQVPDKWFSPNGDGKKDSVSFNVISESAAPYRVEVRKSGSVLTSWGPFVGNQALSWDGKQGDAALPDGQYNIVVYTVEKRERIRDNEKVGIDTVPPTIDYEIKTDKNDPTAGELKVIFKDKGSGIDPSTAKVEQISSEVKPGVPLLQGEGQTTVEKDNVIKKLFNLLFPTFEPTPESQMGGFGLKQVTEPPVENEEGINLKASVFDIAANSASQGMPAPTLNANLLTTPCWSKDKKYLMTGVFDFDPYGPDITLIISPKTLQIHGRVTKEDVRGVDASIIPGEENLIHTYKPENADTIMVFNEKTKKLETPKYAENSKEAWVKSQNAAIQKFVNEAWGWLTAYDSAGRVTVEVGTNDAQKKKLIKDYNNSNSKATAVALENSFKLQNNYPVPNYDFSGNGPGIAHLVSVDLDKPGKDVFSQLAVNQKVVLTTEVNFDTIKITLTKAKSAKNSNNATWRVSCGG